MALPAGVETAADLMARTGADTCLPVAAPLAPLFPLGGPERGRTYAVRGDAAASLVNALVAPVTAMGAWCAFVDLPHAGLRAAQEHGVALERVVCVDTDRSPSSWGRVIGALAEGIEIIVAQDPVCPPAEARRVAARLKARGAVLLVHGRTGDHPVDAVLTARTREWEFGACAVSRTVHVSAEGRRVPGARRVRVLLPSHAGTVAEQ